MPAIKYSQWLLQLQYVQILKANDENQIYTIWEIFEYPEFEEKE